VVPSQKQLEAKARFAEAVAYAKAINNNPKEKAKWKKKVAVGSSVYQTVLKWYLNNKV
jgi:antibiotic biosynthesis monooxygenase (ABM) superfamily enzyme